MQEKSIWKEDYSNDVCPSLTNNISVDVLIIGGGITGISTAYHLINKGLNVCLVEKNTIGSGVTSRTTGKLTYLQEDIASKIKKYCGSEKAKLYISSQMEAIQLVNDIIHKENIICDLEEVDSYVFSLNEKKIEKEKDLLQEFGVKTYSVTKLPDGEDISSGFYVKNTYVFHPLKYVTSLKQICLKNHINIYENTKIVSINKEQNIYVCQTPSHTIKTKYVVLALHYPYFLKPFWMPLKAHIEKSYIEAFLVEQNYKFSAITISKPTISIRFHKTNDKTFQLYLTNSHNLCIKNNEKDNFKELLKSKNKKPSYLWSNKDIITMDYLPYIGSINEENTLLIGTGYNTWGMTNGSLAGKILSDIILHKENSYQNLFTPLRGLNLGKILNFPLVLGSNAYSFIKTKFKIQKPWYSSSIRFETRNGKKVAIYKDQNKKEHVVYAICPHLKCSLIFNETEKTWDCPCHGSRFDIDGHCIEGPSNYNITYKDT